MAAMHALRTSSTLARLVLAWFMLTLGVAAASPLVAPVTMHEVCTGSSVTLVLLDQDGHAVDTDRHALDCPLCLPAALPVGFHIPRADQVQPLAYALLPRQQAHIAGVSGAPLPPRGPPSLR